MGYTVIQLAFISKDIESIVGIYLLIGKQLEVLPYLMVKVINL
jgi:hypothetical protein